ncbi:MAG: response regulator [Bacteroidetes bacterium]|nr:response regulator [Bacteroidota bacterium]
MVALLMICFHNPASTLHAQARPDIDQIRDLIVVSRGFLGSNNHKANEKALEALGMARAAGIDSLKAKAHRFSGISYYYLSDFNSSLKHYDSALYYFIRLNDSIEQARIYNNKGAAYTQLSLFQRAIDEYLKARTIYQAQNNIRGSIIINNNIGSLYQYLRDYNTAMYYYNKAIQIAEQHSFDEELVNTLGNIATVYELSAQPVKAEEAYRKALFKARNLGNQQLAAGVNINFGTFWMSQNQPDSALRYFEAARLASRDMSLNLSKLYLGMARAYKMKGLNELAFSYYQQALDNVGKGNDAVLRLKILHELAQMFALRSDFRSAYKLLNEYAEETDLVRDENDSLKNNIIELHFNLANLNTLADSLRMANHVLSQRASSTQRTNLSLWILLGLSLTAILVLLIRTLKKRRRIQVLENEKEMMQERLSQMDELKDQVSQLSRTNLELREHFEYLVNSYPNPLGIKRKDSFWITGNSGMCHLLGVPEGKLNQCTREQLMAATIRTPELLRMLEVAEELTWMKGKTTITLEHLHAEEGEDLGKFRIIRVPVFEQNGEPKFLVIYAIPADNEQFSPQSRQQYLHEALSVISHELRTPLNAIVGFSDMLTEDETDQAKRRQYARIIQRNSSTLLRLTEELVLFSSLHLGDVPLAVNAFNFREIFTTLHARLISRAIELGKHQLQVKLSIPQGPCVVSGDEEKWQHLLDVLADNALRFTKQGTITLGYEISGDGQQRNILAFVEDSGPGIPQELSTKVFEPFFRYSAGEPLHSGAGLGLSIARKLALIMGVRLDMRSSAGKGTRFELVFQPEFQEQAAIRPVVKEVEKVTKLKGKKILVVEDTQSNSELLKIILEGAGAIVIQTISGEEAVNICARQGDIDLVLMDIQLPGINGLDATRQIKQIRPELPVIAHTAYAMANEKEACFAAGCDGYVAKPIKPRLLLPILEQLFKNY